MREKLQSITDFKVMSFDEGLKALNWSSQEDNGNLKIVCLCGNNKIECSGFLRTEVIECKSCGKRMTDLFSPIKTGNSVCTILNSDDYEIEKDNNDSLRYWIAEDSSGGIKIK